ncbi:Uncharacterized protein TPAR_03396 [Tolypocladium paradoxum]|uniref:Deoxyribonuclease NucA/NucB domain-containing protein n=1 Tax=Tolypocladium paradoxum TaxID=94208 RepID=A0A2S4L1S0_9HYPO|nr:Uncharacterized protein TPAR_03396 [Tolypocladium paradoxum]
MSSKALFLFTGLAWIAMAPRALSPSPDVAFLCDKLPEICSNMCWAVRCASPVFPETLTWDNPDKSTQDKRRASSGCQRSGNKCGTKKQAWATVAVYTSPVTSTRLPRQTRARFQMAIKSLAAFSRCVPRPENSRQGQALKTVYSRWKKQGLTSHSLKIHLWQPRDLGRQVLRQPALQERRVPVEDVEGESVRVISVTILEEVPVEAVLGQQSYIKAFSSSLYICSHWGNSFRMDSSSMSDSALYIKANAAEAVSPRMNAPSVDAQSITNAVQTNPDGPVILESELGPERNITALKFVAQVGDVLCLLTHMVKGERNSQGAVRGINVNLSVLDLHCHAMVARVPVFSSINSERHLLWLRFFVAELFSRLFSSLLVIVVRVSLRFDLFQSNLSSSGTFKASSINPSAKIAAISLDQSAFPFHVVIHTRDD